MKKLITNFLVFALFCIASNLTYGQGAAGKISGKVTDAATGEPLIGANVIVMNTNLGGATDINGQYFVLNIVPGTYTLQATYVGYAPKTIKEVRIVGGVTYDLDIQLTSDFTLPDVVIQGKKFFEENATNTNRVIDAEEINRLPVKGVEQLASLQAGVVTSEGSGGAEGNAAINVRGGRGNEVLYIVDGVVQNDIYTGANYSQLSNSAIEQLSFQIGGYEAKYGQAQSGIISVTTKAGDASYGFYADALTSSFTDDYGYNLYTMNLSGPIVPGGENSGNHTFFLSAERGWFLDADPKAIGISFNSDVKKSSNVLPDNSSSVWRYTARTNHSFGDFSVRLGANINTRDYRGYIHGYAKSNSMHNPRFERENMSFSARLSQRITQSTFWNLNLGYKMFKEVEGDGVWFDNLEAYGDSLANFQAQGIRLPNGNGSQLTTDKVGIFNSYGRVRSAYNKTKNNTMSADLDLTSQLDEHLFEIGGGISLNDLRFYSIAPVGLAANNLKSLSDSARYARLQPTAFGYDVMGNETDADGFEPKNPLVAYGYIQDRFELSDMVLNIGLRFDYFDTKAEIIKDPKLPYGFGDPNEYDAADFETKTPEFYISPRIGLGFPITATTVFHAQYGKFIQQPPLNNLYSTIYDLNFLITDNNWNLNTGHIESEITTQYEVGFRQVIGEIAALNVTAFYKNTEGLLNSAVVEFQRQSGGQTLKYITPTNTDFGTVKGLSVALDVTRMSYFSLSLDYTYSLAEGTGSSTNSSFTAAFRNVNGEIPKVIAPLDFDQRHTGVINLDFYVPKDNLGFLELTNANFLVSFNSGRPYTPVESQNLIAGATNYGETKGYVNSVYGPSNFRVDFKMEKSFNFGNFFLTPYVWIENLFDADNAVAVYRSTGDPLTTAYLTSKEAKDIAAGAGQNWVEDYKSLERNPFNFGIPRLIRLGLKVNFSNITF